MPTELQSYGEKRAYCQRGPRGEFFGIHPEIDPRHENRHVGRHVRLQNEETVAPFEGKRRLNSVNQ